MDNVTPKVKAQGGTCRLEKEILGERAEGGTRNERTRNLGAGKEIRNKKQR